MARPDLKALCAMLGSLRCTERAQGESPQRDRTPQSRTRFTDKALASAERGRAEL